MTIETRDFCASSDFGYTGQYIARIVGRDPKVTFCREFIGTRSGKRNEHTSALVDEPCLIERCNVTRKGKDQAYFIVVRDGEGNLRSLACDRADAMAIAKRLDQREELGEIIGLEPHPEGGENKVGLPRLQWSIRTPGEAKRAVAASNIESAVDAIVLALQALPASDQKKALTAARAKLLAPATTEGLAAPALAPTEVAC